MQVNIERLDDFGRGIGYVNDKVTFIFGVVPQDIVDIKIIKETKKYNIGKVIKYLKYSPKRIEAPCPYFLTCGGCSLQFLTYHDTITYKFNKVINLFKKNKILVNPQVVVNPQPYYYRNKINLKVISQKIGYYEMNSHNIVKIDTCLIANRCLNETLKIIEDFAIINGDVTIRCNQEEEILIIINSNDKLNIDVNTIKSKIKLVGIVINNQIFYGENFLYEKINNFLFKISYDSFFQVNNFVASKLFDIVANNIFEQDKVLDLYCGVGTLSLVSAINAKKVIGVEIGKNAIINARNNAKVNNITNVEFINSDVAEVITNLGTDFTKIIVDPPRSGLTSKIVNTILAIKPEVIIYVSCDPNTLVRDYKLLSDNYKINQSYILDMFSYTYHVETILILKRHVK